MVSDAREHCTFIRLKYCAALKTVRVREELSRIIQCAANMNIAFIRPTFHNKEQNIKNRDSEINLKSDFQGFKLRKTKSVLNSF